MSCDGASVLYTAWVTMRLAAAFSVIGWFTWAAFSRTTLRVTASSSWTLTPPVWVWKKGWSPVARERVPHRIEVARVVAPRRRGRQEHGPEPGGGDPLDLGDGVGDVGDRDRRGGADAVEVRREPLGDVVVVDAGVRHRELVVVGVEPEQREVRVHHLHVDAVEVHVLEDDVGIALGRAPAGLAVAGDRPALVAGGVQPPEDGGAALDERLDLEVLLPHRPIAEVLGEAGLEQVDGLEEVPVARDDEVLRRSWLASPRAETWFSTMRERLLQGYAQR